MRLGLLLVAMAHTAAPVTALSDPPPQAAPQAIIWEGTTNAILALGVSYPLRASVAAGLPVTLELISGSATLADGSITVNAYGTVVVEASQAGDEQHLPAKARRSFNVRQTQFTRVGRCETGGIARGLYLAGDYAYIAAGWEFNVVSLKDVTNPTLVGSLNTLGDARAVRVEGDYAYVAAGSAGLRVLDVSNPARPLDIGGYATPAYDLEIAGDFAYLAGGTSGVRVIEISVPNDPILVGRAGAGPFASNLRLSGDIVYVGGSNRGFETFSVAKPWRPKSLATLPGVAQGIDVAGNFAYVAAGFDGFQVVDVRNPSAPVKIGKLGSLWTNYYRGVRVVGQYAYLDTYGLLEAVDIADPENPVSVGKQRVAYSTSVAGTKGDLLVVAEGSGLSVLKVRQGYANRIDFTPPETLVLTNEFIPLPLLSSSGGTITYKVLEGPAVIDAGRIVFTGPGEAKVRAEQPGDEAVLPVSVDWIIRGYQLTQTLSWQGTGLDRLEPNLPFPLSASSDWGLPVAVRVEHGPAVLQNGMLTVTGPGAIVVTAEQPGNPGYVPAKLSRRFNVRQGRITYRGVYKPDAIDGPVQSLDVQGNHAYLAEGNNSFEVIDIFNPARPVKEGVLNLGYVNLVRVADTKACVLGGGSLIVVDVSDPSHPRRQGSISTGMGFPTGLAVVGNRAYITLGSAGLQVVDFSDPEKPRLENLYPTSDFLSGVHVTGQTAYLAGSANGLFVIDLSSTSTSGRAVPGVPHSLDVAVEGTRAYLATSVGVAIVDVGGDFPALIGTGLPDVYDFRVAASGDYIYLAGSSSLVVADVSDPANPMVAGRISVSRNVTDMRVVGNRVYFAAGEDGFLIYEVGIGYLQSFQVQLPLKIAPRPVRFDPIGVSSSGLPLSITVQSGPAQVVDGVLRPTGPGQVVLRVQQVGDSYYLPVSSVWGLTISPPELGVRAMGARAELRWPAGLTGFKLQSRASLESKDAWEDVTEPPIDADGESSVGLDKSAGQRYFRLIRP